MHSIFFPITLPQYNALRLGEPIGLDKDIKIKQSCVRTLAQYIYCRLHVLQWLKSSQAVTLATFWRKRLSELLRIENRSYQMLDETGISRRFGYARQYAFVVLLLTYRNVIFQFNIGDFTRRCPQKGLSQCPRKGTSWHLRPAKSQISLRIRAV